MCATFFSCHLFIQLLYSCLLQNLLAGALYGKLGGLFFACLFTSMGATMCYILSLTFAKELVLTYFHDRFSNFQKKVKENEDNLLPFMLFIRLVPIAPGWVINVVAPLLDVPVPIFILSTFFGKYYAFSHLSHKIISKGELLINYDFIN